MVKFTNQQRLEIIKNYYRNSESVVGTLRALTPIFGRNNRPTRQAVRAIVDKFETKFTLLDVPVPKRRRIARSEEIIAAVNASIQNEPNNAFKIKLTQELKPLDHLKRRTIDLLKGEFGERVISRNGPVEWPPRSCDLTPMDFFYGAISSHWSMPTSQQL